MPPEFHNDAIILSGILGTELKSKIIHKYYRVWWRITSGGKSRYYNWETSIVEMNAATGEIYIPERNCTILGSAGAALQLKFYNQEVNNPNLNLILVENDEQCIYHLRNVIKRRFPRAIINDDPSRFDKNDNQCVLIRRDVDEAVKAVNDLNIGGRTIYFFDPLLAIDFDPIIEVYENRVRSPLNIGTEFIIFFLLQIGSLAEMILHHYQPLLTLALGVTMIEKLLMHYLMF